MALVFCEFVLYYITLYSCAYPEPGEERRGEEDELRVMVLADTHLLGNLQFSWQCCGSGIFIPDLGSRIPDPKTATKERGEKKKNFHNFLCSHKFHKIANYFSFEVLKKKNLGQFSKNYRTFYPKNCH
jgi:hypothetical protein